MGPVARPSNMPQYATCLAHVGGTRIQQWWVQYDDIIEVCGTRTYWNRRHCSELFLTKCSAGPMNHPVLFPNVDIRHIARSWKRSPWKMPWTAQLPWRRACRTSGRPVVTNGKDIIHEVCRSVALVTQICDDKVMLLADETYMKMPRGPKKELQDELWNEDMTMTIFCVGVGGSQELYINYV